MDIKQFTTPQAQPKRIRFTGASHLPYNAFRETPGVFRSGRRGDNLYLKENHQQSTPVRTNKLAIRKLDSNGGSESTSRKRRRLSSPGYEITGFRTPLMQVSHGNTQSPAAVIKVSSASLISRTFPSIKIPATSATRLHQIHPLHFSVASRKRQKITVLTEAAKRLHKETRKQSPGNSSAITLKRQYPWLISKPKPPTPPPWLYNPREKPAFQFSGVRIENRK